MRRRHGGRISFRGALFGLLLSLAALVPHVTFALEAGAALHCLPRHHGGHDMEGPQDHRSPTSRSMPAHLMPLQVCCGLLNPETGALVPTITVYADMDYATPPVPDFASLAIPPEPPPPRS